MADDLAVDPMDEFPGATVKHQESLMMLVKDESFGVILNDVILGLYTMIDLRVGSLQERDPFRARIMLWCEYIIEMMLMCLDTINAHENTRKSGIDLHKFVPAHIPHVRFSVRLGKRKKKHKRGGRKKVPTRHLKRFSVDAFTRAVVGPLEAMVVPSEDQMPQKSKHQSGVVRIGRETLMLASHKFAEEPVDFTEVQVRYKNNQKRKLEKQLKEEDGKTDRPLPDKYGIWEYHLAILGQQCHNEVHNYLECHLGAQSMVRQKVSSKA